MKTGNEASIEQDITLQHVREIRRYNDWIFSLLASHVRGRVLEVGCGIGTYTSRLRPRCQSLVAFDQDPSYASQVEARFRDDDQVEVFCGSLGDGVEYEPETFDTIVCLNVLEHIGDDLSAVVGFRRWLRPGGMLCLQVPAHGWLYGCVDRAVGHHRRYTRRGLSALLTESGMSPVYGPRYLYCLAIPGWWWVGQVRRLEVVPAGSVWLANLMAAASRCVETVVRPPVGLTLVTVVRS